MASATLKDYQRVDPRMLDPDALEQVLANNKAARSNTAITGVELGLAGDERRARGQQVLQALSETNALINNQNFRALDDEQKQAAIKALVGLIEKNPDAILAGLDIFGAGSQGGQVSPDALAAIKAGIADRRRASAAYTLSQSGEGAQKAREAGIAMPANVFGDRIGSTGLQDVVPTSIERAGIEKNEDSVTINAFPGANNAATIKSTGANAPERATALQRRRDLLTGISTLPENISGVNVGANTSADMSPTTAAQIAADLKQLEAMAKAANVTFLSPKWAQDSVTGQWKRRGLKFDGTPGVFKRAIDADGKLKLIFSPSSQASSGQASSEQ